MRPQLLFSREGLALSEILFVYAKEMEWLLHEGSKLLFEWFYLYVSVFYGICTMRKTLYKKLKHFLWHIVDILTIL